MRGIDDDGPPTVSPAERVFTYVLTRGTTARAELADVLGVSAAAVTRIVRPLVADGLLRERRSPTSGNGAGRPVQLLEVVSERPRFVGVKVNRSEVVAVRTNLRAEIQDTTRVALPVPGSRTAVEVEDVVVAIGQLVSRFAGAGPLAGVGIAVSGDIDRVTGEVDLSPLLGWRGVALGSALGTLIDVPVVVDNDVRAVTTAEQWFGDGVGVDPFAVVTVGAGIGCGVVIGDRVARGAFGVSSELGHVCVDIDGPRCHCGARGCVEAIAATGPLLSAASRAAGTRIRSLQRLSEMVADDRARTAVLEPVIDRARRALSAAVGAVVNLVGPQRLLISAEGFDLDTLFGSRFHDELTQRMFGRAGSVEIVKKTLPFTEWARGAAVAAITQSVRQHS